MYRIPREEKHNRPNLRQIQTKTSHLTSGNHTKRICSQNCISFFVFIRKHTLPERSEWSPWSNTDVDLPKNEPTETTAIPLYYAILVVFTPRNDPPNENRGYRKQKRTENVKIILLRYVTAMGAA